MLPKYCAVRKTQSGFEVNDVGNQCYNSFSWDHVADLCGLSDLDTYPLLLGLAFLRSALVINMKEG